MKPLGTWLTRLGASAALAIVFGCGSGDVPDPGSDGQMAALPESSGPAEPAAPAPAPAPQVAADEGKGEDVKAEDTTAQPAAPASEPAGAAAPDRNSATAEMLAMATKEQPAPPSAAGEDTAGGAPGPGAGAGPGGMGAGMRPPGMGPGGGQGGPGAGGMGAGMQGMQAQMQQQQQMQAQMKNQMQGMQAQMKGQMQGGAGGMPGMGGPGGPGGNNDKPPDFRRPEGAVEAFLSALKAKDLNRLSDATALRAGTNEDTVKRNQDMFRRIVETTLSESELNDLAASLEGYKVSGFNQAKSSGRLGVILSKTGSNRARLTIVITVRREKKGWGVCDISRPAELKNPGFGPPARQSKRT